MSAGARGVGLGDFQALAVGVVLAVHGDQRGHAEATLVLFPHLGARAFRRHHDHRDVVADLHAFLDDIEAVRIRQAGALLHERHDLADHGAVLLVRSQVEHEVGCRDQVGVGAHGEPVLRGIAPGRALLGDRRIAQRVGDVQPAVAEVQSLVEALGATANDNQLLAAQSVDAIDELTAVHEAAFAELLELQPERQAVEVVLSHARRSPVDAVARV